MISGRPDAIRWLSGSVLCLLVAMLGVGFPEAVRRMRISPRFVLLGCLCVQFAALLWTPVNGPLETAGVKAVRGISFLLAGAAVLAGTLATSDWRTRK